jgi:hypothetical protein
MRALAVGLVAAVGAAGVAGRDRWSRSRFWDAGAVLGRFVDAAPPRALVVTSDFQTIFGLWYLIAVEGRRPDLIIVHRHFLAYPGYRDELIHAHAELAPLLGAHDVECERVLTFEPTVIQYDLDLDARLAARAVTVPVSLPLAEPQTLRFAAWQAFLAAHQACTLGRDPAPALARARRVLGMPALNCDHVRDPVTIGSP